MKKLIYAVFLTTLIVNVSACGTIMYPERKGQRSGRIDAGVAVLDGVGLLFFLIPGVIAYAVDFSTGAIYLPGGSRADIDGNVNTSNMRVLHVGKENLSEAAIEQAIFAETGKHVDMRQPGVQVYKLDAAGKKERATNPLS